MTSEKRTQPPSPPPVLEASKRYVASEPESWMVWAVLSMIFCCFPFGLIAILSVLKTKRLWDTGRREQACKQHKRTKIWVLITIPLGLFLYWLIFIILIPVMLFMMESAAMPNSPLPMAQPGILAESTSNEDKGRTISHYLIASDTLETICVMYNVTIDELKVHNAGLQSNEDLKGRKTLQIPAGL